MPTRRCSQCGQEIPAGQPACPVCSAHPRFWGFRRDSLLMAVFVAVAVVLLAFTSFAARLYHAHHDRLAQQWFERGRAELAAENPQDAIRYLRNALVFSRDNFSFRLLLAQALSRAGRDDEARSYFLNLWRREPGNAVINVELARSAAARGSVAEAVRYYQNAIHGLWPEGPEQNRLAARMELIQFLLKHQRAGEAHAEIMAYITEMPKEAARHVETGRLLLQVGQAEQAQQQFIAALALDRRSEPALAGAGEAAFRAGNYVAARRYLERALRENPDNAEAAQLLELATTVLGLDPFRPRLSAAERSRRATRVFQRSLERLRACAAARGVELEDESEPDNRLQTLHQRARELRPRLRPAALRSDPDLLEAATDLGFEMQQAAREACGAPDQTPDRALLLIAQQREAAER